MLKNEPLTSIVMTIKNGARFLPDALASIDQLGDQNIETILIDGGSSDPIEEVVSSCQDRIRFFSRPDLSRVERLNYGVDLANGEFVTFLDADDAFYPDKLTIQRSIFAEHPDVELVFGLSREDTCIPDLARVDVKEGVQFRLLKGAALIRKSLFDTVGHFDTFLNIGEDTDWFFRAKESGAVIFVHEEPMLLVRRHAMSLTKDPANQYRRHVFQVLKKARDRKKAAGLPSGSDAHAVTPISHDALIRLWHTFQPG